MPVVYVRSSPDEIHMAAAEADARSSQSAGLEGDLRCRNCGYDLRGSVVQCSECGELVEQSIAAAYAELKARRTRPLLIGVGIATGVILPLLNLLLIFVSLMAAVAAFDTEVSSYLFWPVEFSGWAAIFWLTVGLVWLIVVLSSWAHRRDLRGRLVISLLPLVAAIALLLINLWFWIQLLSIDCI